MIKRVIVGVNMLEKNVATQSIRQKGWTKISGSLESISPKIMRDMHLNEKCVSVEKYVAMFSFHDSVFL